MESAIKTVVGQYVSSARGKESLNKDNFQKLVQRQLGNIMSVRWSRVYITDHHPVLYSFGLVVKAVK